MTCLKFDRIMNGKDQIILLKWTTKTCVTDQNFAFDCVITLRS